MNVHICTNCGVPVQTLSWLNSFKRDGRLYCRKCGGVLEPRDVPYDKLHEQEHPYLNRVTRRFEAFEMISWGLLFFLGITILVVAVAQ
jgi:NAD-dependent SIR2 family protein deacetylase